MKRIIVEVSIVVGVVAATLGASYLILAFLERNP